MSKKMAESGVNVTCKDAVREGVQDRGLQLEVLAGRSVISQAVLAAAAYGDVWGVCVQVQDWHRV